MQSYAEFKRAISRRETPFHAFIYDAAKKVLGFSFPVIPGLHRFLYHEWAERTSMWHNFWRVAYYEPMFKSMCKEVGPGFKMWYAGNGVTRILGKLDIYLGSNVTMFDNVGLVGLRLFDTPSLVVGDDTYIGPLTRFMVAKRITLGKKTILGSRIMVMDNSGHPVNDAVGRLEHGGGLPRKESVKEVKIGDLCFLGAGSYVYPGVHVGDGVVAKAGTHLTGHVPPFCLVGGNPGKVLGKLLINDKLKEHFGEERHRQWKEQQAAVRIEG